MFDYARRTSTNIHDGTKPCKHHYITPYNQTVIFRVLPVYHLEIIKEALLPSFVMKNENKDKQEKKCEASLDFECIC